MGDEHELKEIDAIMTNVWKKNEVARQECFHKILGNPVHGTSQISKQKLIFTASLIGSAANADGNIQKEEILELDQVLNGLFSTHEISANVRDIMKDRVQNPINMMELRDTYRSLGDVSDDEKENYREFLNTIISTDCAVTLDEQVYQFKVELILDSLPDLDIYAISESPRSSNKDVVKYINMKYIQGQFPKTNMSTLSTEVVYTKHPASNDELVPISLFFDDNFAQDKDTELVRIAQLAGAKSVEIHSFSKEDESNSYDAEAQIGGKYNLATVDVNAKSAASRISEMESKSKLVFSFEGVTPPSFLQNLFGRKERYILSRTKWLKADSKLSAFVESCFSTNRIKTFEWEVEYCEVGSAMMSAAVAARCNLPGVKANMKASYESNAKKMFHKKNRYFITFA